MRLLLFLIFCCQITLSTCSNFVSKCWSLLKKNKHCIWHDSVGIQRWEPKITVEGYQKSFQKISGKDLCGHVLWWWSILLPQLWSQGLVTDLLEVAAFSSLLRIWGECSATHSLPALSFFLFCQVEISLRTLIPLCRPGSVHSSSASWDYCGWVLPDESCVSWFPVRLPHCDWTA